MTIVILCIFNKPGLAQVGAISKAQKRGPFGLVRYCMLRGKPFWFSSLGQRVQFGVFLKFCITFGVELFWSLWISDYGCLVLWDFVGKKKNYSQHVRFYHVFVQKKLFSSLMGTPLGIFFSV